MQDIDFFNSLSDTEKYAWNAFKLVCANFLGSHKTEEYKGTVNNMRRCFQCMKCRMSPKLHILDCHLDFFLKTWAK